MSIPFPTDLVRIPFDWAQAEANRRQAREANRKQLEFAREQMMRGERLQREFAQHGLSWKIADARAAGIHPLAALGMQPSHASPVTVGLDQQSHEPPYSQMGQNISRAMQAAMTKADRAAQNALLEEQIKQARAQTVILESQATEAASKVANPPMQSLVEEKPQELMMSHPDLPHVAPRSTVGSQITRLPEGGALTTMTPELAEQMEDDFIGKMVWRVHNAFVPPPDSDLPPGAVGWRMVTPWSYKPVFSPHKPPGRLRRGLYYYKKDWR